MFFTITFIKFTCKLTLDINISNEWKIKMIIYTLYKYELYCELYITKRQTVLFPLKYRVVRFILQLYLIL